MLLKYKTVMMTGGASGIGRATVLMLAKEGARVLLCDVNEAGANETIKMAGGSGVEKLRDHFAARHHAASLAESAKPAELEQDWEAYLDGVYGVCLREVTPETIVRKGVLVSSLCQLLVLARPRNPEWRQALHEQVAELDGLEREFAPNYDRGAQQERPPTRDLLIKEAHKRFPDLFAEQAAPRRRSAAVG